MRCLWLLVAAELCCIVLARAESYNSLLALGPRSAMVTYAAVAAALHPGPVLSFGENSSGFAMKIDFV